ncbi:MAG: hypothetical protein FD180_4069 [Planctomycetota bacterium]|nr:MAG: hypothetical protein FD180_4069 [Planctomycetota bacterium]
MRSASSIQFCLAVLGMVLAGCKSSDSSEDRKEGEAPKRPPKVATMYVESKGEPLNVGGKKVEKSNEGGSAKGGFSPKDLLMPGMFVLVSGATALGGPLLIRALDKEDRPSGGIAIASGGADGTFVPVETSGAGSTSGGVSGTGGSGSSGSAAPGGSSAPDPGTVTAVSKASESASATTLAAGTGVASTPSSVLLSMGYASDFSGPSYISGKMTSTGKEMFHGMEVHIYTWDLTVDKTSSARSGKVDVFATFTGLKAGDSVTVFITVTGDATFTCDHTPLVSTVPLGGLGANWLFLQVPYEGSPPLKIYSVTFLLPAASTPIKLGYLTVEGETDIFGESTAEVTVH